MWKLTLGYGSKIIFEIDINNENYWKPYGNHMGTIWEHMRDMKQEGGVIKLINLHFLCIICISFPPFQNEASTKIEIFI